MDRPLGVADGRGPELDPGDPGTYTLIGTELATRLQALAHQRPTRPVQEGVGDTVRHVMTTGDRAVVNSC